jgi:hypothetical protein
VPAAKARAGIEQDIGEAAEDLQNRLESRDAARVEL